jgi:ABC-type multidrug transport system permease subunit
MKIFILKVKREIIRTQLEYLYFRLLLSRIFIYGLIGGCAKSNVNPVAFVLFLLMIPIFILGSILKPVSIPCYGTIIAILLPIVCANKYASRKK